MAPVGLGWVQRSKRPLAGASLGHKMWKVWRQEASRASPTPWAHYRGSVLGFWEPAESR